MKQKYFIGIDVSKDKLDCAVMASDYSVLIEKIIINKDQKIASFFKAFMKKAMVNAEELLVCIESTGIYGRNIERVCLALNIPFWEEQALKIKRASTDFRGKNDKKDALRIAEYCLRYENRKLLKTKVKPEIAELRALAKSRETLLGQKLALENQLREAESHDPALYKVLKKQFDVVKKTIVKAIKSVEADIKELVSETQEIKTNIDLIKTIPGIGQTTAVQFVIHTNNFENFKSAKHLACFAGVVPFSNESGTIVKKPRVSKMANMKLKTLLHLAALSAVRSKSELKEYYIRKVSEGKNKMSVINAIRNKLVHRIWSVVNRQTAYIGMEEFLSKSKITLDF